jgi:hypothetical protein
MAAVASGKAAIDVMTTKRKSPHRKSGAGFGEKFESNLVAAAATAVATAATAVRFGEIIRGRHATKFEGHADVFANDLLDHFQFTLGFEETTGDFVFEQSVAGGFELADFRGAEFHTGVLLVVKLFAALVNALVLKTRGIVIEETLDRFLQLLETGLGHDLGAQLLGLRHQSGIIGKHRHAAPLPSVPARRNPHLWKVSPSVL